MRFVTNSENMVTSPCQEPNYRFRNHF